MRMEVVGVGAYLQEDEEARRVSPQCLVVAAPGVPASPPSPGRPPLGQGCGNLLPPSGGFQVCSPVWAACSPDGKGRKVKGW